MRDDRAKDRPGFPRVRAWLEMVQEFPGKYRQVLARAQAERASWVPSLVTFAMHESPRSARMAARLLGDLVKRSRTMDEVLDLNRHLPQQSSALADVALAVTERIMGNLADAQRMVGAEAAKLWNNLAVRCHEANQPARALELAELALKVSGPLNDTPANRRTRVLCLLTAAKLRAEHGQTRSALTAANEAVALTAKLGRNGKGGDAVLWARALTIRANRLAALGQIAEALSDLRQARRRLGHAPVSRESRHDVAVAELAMANALNHLGNYAEGLQHAEEADRLFRTLVAESPDQYLEYAAAAATAFSQGLSQTGKLELSYEVARQAVERMQVLVERQPRRFGSEFTAHLISLSDSAGELGRFEEAVVFGERALRNARRVGERMGQRDWYLEGVAACNLFNLYYRLERLQDAAQVIRRALRSYQRLPDSHPEAHTERARALRNLAEVEQMLAKPGRARKAVRAARQALAVVQQAPLRSSDAVQLLEAQCRTTLATCLAEDGNLTEAIVEEEASTQIRRSLYQRSPSVYGSDVAYSLYKLSALLMKAGKTEAAKTSASRAVALYEEVLPSSAERTAAFLADSLQVLGSLYRKEGRTDDAIQTFERAIRLLRPRYEAAPEVWHSTLLRICVRYVDACTEGAVAYRPELVEDVIARAVPDGALNR